MQTPTEPTNNLTQQVRKICARSKNKLQFPPGSPIGSSTNASATGLEKRMQAAQSPIQSKSFVILAAYTVLNQKIQSLSNAISN